MKKKSETTLKRQKVIYLLPFFYRKLIIEYLMYFAQYIPGFSKNWSYEYSGQLNETVQKVHSV